MMRCLCSTTTIAFFLDFFLFDDDDAAGLKEEATFDDAKRNFPMYAIVFYDNFFVSQINSDRINRDKRKQW